MENMITAVNEEGYRYLGIIELDKAKEQEMKLEFRVEYMRRRKLIMKSKLHGRNKVKANDTCNTKQFRNISIK